MLPLGSKVNPSDPLIADFRNFLYVAFKHLRPNHPGPTPAQYEIAAFLQHGWALYGEELSMEHGRLDLIEAFRGVGKSEILACYALWRLLRNAEEEKILVISATSLKAKKFVKQTKELLMTLPELTQLRPQTWQRNAFDLFDVRGASNTQSPSVQAQGIGGQITGDRASLVIADDVEIWENSRTEERRVVLIDRTLEFSNLIYPADPERGYEGGDIIFLGTPQTEESIYTKQVKERGYRAWVWPARYPDSTASAHYVVTTSEGRTVNTLAPPIIEAIRADRGVIGKPTDTRFNNYTLMEREARGKLNWSLQYMLDTSVSDEARYPLKQRDIMCFPTNPLRAPRIVQWGRDTDRKNVLNDAPNYGFTGDVWMSPLFRSENDDWAPYDTKILYVDTSGRGDDETAWCVLGVLNGTYWVLHLDGMTGVEARAAMMQRPTPTGIPMDSYDLRMEKIANDARNFGVDKVWIETNFGDGLWTKAFQPILAKVWPAKQKDDGAGCVCEEVRVSGQKEVRICDTLEPVLLNHRMVINEVIARNDETFGYQLTHITREKGALKHDDRIDCLAGAVSVLLDALGQEQREAAASQRDELTDRMLEHFITSNMEARQRNGGTPGRLRSSRIGRHLQRPEDYDEWEDSEVFSATV